MAGSEVVVVGDDLSDRSDGGLSDRLPSGGCVLLGVDVCASAGTIPATAMPNNRAINNLMTRSKLSGRFQKVGSIHLCMGKVSRG